MFLLYFEKCSVHFTFNEKVIILLNKIGKKAHRIQELTEENLCDKFLFNEILKNKKILTFFDISGYLPKTEKIKNPTNKRICPKYVQLV